MKSKGAVGNLIRSIEQGNVDGDLVTPRSDPTQRNGLGGEERNDPREEVETFLRYISTQNPHGDVIMPEQSEEFDVLEYIDRITKEE